MTAVQFECETKPTRPKAFRWRTLFIGGALALVAIAAFVAFRHYSFGSSNDKFKQAISALDRGDWSLARRYARELRAAQPDSPEASLLRGAMLLERGYCYPALDELGKARQKAVLEIPALTMMGKAWYLLGRHVEAQAALQEALDSEPDSVEAHRWLAASYYDLGVIGLATEHLRRTAELDPADPRPYRLIGLMHKDFWQYKEAIPFYIESLRRNSDQKDADEIRQELASCQVEARLYADALTTLEKCPDSAEFNILRAKCHHAQGRFGIAKTVLARAIEQDAKNLDGMLLQGMMLLEEGDARAAIDAFQKASRAHPREYMAHFMLAQAYGKAGDQERSEAEHKLADRIGSIRHEFSELHKTAWQNPNNVQVRLRLATLAQELDRPDLAEVWLRAAAAIQPITPSEDK